MADEDIFEKTVPCSFEVDGVSDRLTFAILQINENGENRIAERKRVYRSKSRLDGTGTESDRYNVTAVFFNGMREPGVSPNPYPEEVNQLIALLKKSYKKTGTLELPTVGPKRCKAQLWQRSEGKELRDYCRLDITFIEDGEETQLESTFAPPNARSAAIAMATRAVQGCVFVGVWSADVAGLEQLAADLENLAVSPTDYVSDLDEKARELQGALDRIEMAFLPSSAMLLAGDVVIGETSQTLLSDPAACDALRAMRLLGEMAMQAVANVPGRASPRPVTYPIAVSLFDVAIEQNVSIEKLCELNTSLPEPRYIPPNTTIFLPGLA